MIEKKDKERIIEESKKYTTKELKEKIVGSREVFDILEEQYNKRVDRTITELFFETLMTMVSWGMILLVASIYYFTALPTYLGVNNEFTNPTTNITGLNNSMQIVLKVIPIMGEKLQPVKEHAGLFFWLWWVVVFFTFILPILSLIYKLIRRKIELNKKR